MTTKRGVYLDLNDSKFIFEYDNLKLVFSSKFYLEKFKSMYTLFIREETNKLAINYKGIVYADEVLLLKLYKQIEKRGFLVFYKDKKIDKDYYIEFKLNLDYS